MQARPRCPRFSAAINRDHDGRLPAASRDEVARALLESGCRYAVCAGANASEWETTVDLAFVRATSGSDGSAEDAGVMTTSHAAEAVEDVGFFFVSCTNFGEHHHDPHSADRRGGAHGPRRRCRSPHQCLTGDTTGTEGL